MSTAIRNQIYGTTSQDIMKINDNFEQLWYKVHGGINYKDTDRNTRSKIQTQWIPVQSEGNFDHNFPLEIRFFIPPNTEKIKYTSFNMQVNNYRMDSSITVAEELSFPVDVKMGIAKASIECEIENSNVTGTVNSSSKNANVQRWFSKTTSDGIVMPTKRADFKTTDGKGTVQAQLANAEYLNDSGQSITIPYLEGDGAKGLIVKEAKVDGKSVYYIDIADMQHSFNVSFESTFNSSPHNHALKQTPHTHEMLATGTLPPHTHKLKEGIYISNQKPKNVEVMLNGHKIADMTSDETIEGLNVKEYIKLGNWNLIKVTTSNLARFLVYGIIELELKN